MGTTYSIVIADSEYNDKDFNIINFGIDSILTLINDQMSTYKPDSDISQFNNSLKPNHIFSDDFYYVLEWSKRYHILTNGALDITVYPFIETWGFFSGLNSDDVPSKMEITTIMNHVGLHKIEFKLNNKIKKRDPFVKIDVSAIAKGFAVDKILEFIKELRFDNVMVEIGGEIRTSGYNNNRKPWRIGIESPSINDRTINKILTISNKAVATSGDYRNYFKLNGKMYSHIIDPSTGYPPENNIASVTVIADTCLDADALATSIMVMGVELGLELINKLANTECMIIERELDSNKFIYHQSIGFNAYIN